MQPRTHLSSAIILGAALSASAMAADAPQKISGSQVETVAEQHVEKIGSEAHILSLIRLEGKNSGSFLDGATTHSMSIGDFINGNGPFHGYIMFEETNNGSVTFLYTGQLTTTPVGGKPKTEWTLTWQIVDGTGRFATVRGQGIAHGGEIAERQNRTDWEGTATGVPQ